MSAEHDNPRCAAGYGRADRLRWPAIPAPSAC